MHLFFIDDSKQEKPSRPKMGKMVAVGGLVVEASKIQALEKDLDAICLNFGFPPGEIFKWSPASHHWMRENLIDQRRQAFQIAILASLLKFEAKAIFIAEDSGCSPAERSSTSPEVDVAKLLIERVDWFFQNASTTGLIIVDRPGGGKKEEETYLLNCLETLRSGTRYRQPSTILMSVLSLSMTLSRVLQCADLITGATLSYVCGLTTYSAPLMEYIQPLFLKESGRVGGVGVKLHPWLKFGNLYHWLFQDSHYVHNLQGIPLPYDQIAFKKSSMEY